MNLSEYCSHLKHRGIDNPRSFLAEKLNVRKGTIDSYICGRRLIPIERCKEVEIATNRKVSCAELRPDIDWQFLLKGFKRNNKSLIEVQE